MGDLTRVIAPARILLHWTRNLGSGAHARANNPSCAKHMLSEGRCFQPSTDAERHRRSPPTGAGCRGRTPGLIEEVPGRTGHLEPAAQARMATRPSIHRRKAEMDPVARTPSLKIAQARAGSTLPAFQHFKLSLWRPAKNPRTKP